jgi:hypothetical protein
VIDVRVRIVREGAEAHGIGVLGWCHCRGTAMYSVAPYLGDGRETGGREMIALDPCMVPGCELIPLLCSGLDSMDAYIALRFTYTKKKKNLMIQALAPSIV